MRVTNLDEQVIQDIGHAFGYYDYGQEHGLIDAFPSRDAAAAFICGYVRMALRGGILYATSERDEGSLAYKRPGERLSLRAMLPLAKGLLGSMTPKALFASPKSWQRANRGLTSGSTGRRGPVSSSASRGGRLCPPAANQPGIRNADAGLALIFPYSRAYNGSSPQSWGL